MKYRAVGCGCFLFLLILANSAFSQVPQSPQVQSYLQQASQAAGPLEAGDLAGIEAALEPGFNEISLMMSTYHPDDRTNTYLRQRGWAHLVWTQLMYRLLAIRDGIYDRELEFAERVAVEDVAKASLQTVQLSHTRLQVLLAAIDKMELGEDIEQFAHAIFDGEDATPYQAMVTDFESRFSLRRKAVQVRLATGIHRGIVDPAELPDGTEYARAYEEHRQRLAGENRIAEVLNCMATADEQEIERLADVALTASDPTERDAARNELKLQLILVEDSMDAFDNDRNVAAMVQYVDNIDTFGYASTAYPDDVQTVKNLVTTARRKMQRQSQPEYLRGLYTIAESVR